jgi:DNA-binding transcriptional MerR regulator
MFRIGAFSKLTTVPVKTLRYYDEIGLFKPSDVDEISGYRHYSASQLPRLNRILALKDLGFSLDQIAGTLDDGLTHKKILEMLELRRKDLGQRIEQEMGKHERVETLIKLIENEGTMTDYDIVLKKVPDQTVAGIKKHVSTPDEGIALFHELYKQLEKAAITPSGLPMAVHAEIEHHGMRQEISAVVPVTVPESEYGYLEGSEGVHVHKLEGGEMACIVHVGSYELIQPAGHAIMQWIEENKFKINGHLRGVYVKSIKDTNNPDEFVTEIQIPIAKA